MKLILLQDVKSVGKKGDLINASEGYAKNFLLPKKLAVEATKSNLNDYELKQKAEAKKELAAKRRQLTQAERRIEELDRLFKRIYEDNVGGKLSDSRFQMLSDDYE